MQNLVDEWGKMLDFFGYYRDGLRGREQSGVVRTNCLDCLDRTNVVQSKIAWRMFKKQVLLSA